jgi:hypothetical protein
MPGPPGRLLLPPLARLPPLHDTSQPPNRIRTTLAPPARKKLPINSPGSPLSSPFHPSTWNESRTEKSLAEPPQVFSLGRFWRLRWTSPLLLPPTPFPSPWRPFSSFSSFFCSKTTRPKNPQRARISSQTFRPLLEAIGSVDQTHETPSSSWTLSSTPSP